MYIVKPKGDNGEKALLWSVRLPGDWGDSKLSHRFHGGGFVAVSDISHFRDSTASHVSLQGLPEMDADFLMYLPLCPYISRRLM